MSKLAAVLASVIAIAGSSQEKPAIAFDAILGCVKAGNCKNMTPGKLNWFDQVGIPVIGFKDDSLQPEERFQRDYLVSRIDNDLFGLREARQPFTNPAWYFDAGLDPSTYVNTPYAPADQRARAFIAYVKQVPAALGHIKANLQLPLPRSYIDISVAGCPG